MFLHAVETHSVEEAAEVIQGQSLQWLIQVAPSGLAVLQLLQGLIQIHLEVKFLHPNVCNLSWVTTLWGALFRSSGEHASSGKTQQDTPQSCKQSGSLT